jgi:carbonyl reductase 1
VTRGGGFKTPDQGAKTPVLLALGDIKEQSGLFWQSEKVLQW